ncbi:MAG: cytochrome c [Desulfobacteraceae bacterium]|jgi:mono/diheme cytochrome c family protein
MNLKICVIAFFIVTISSQFAFSEEMGNPRKGKYLYRKNCLVCHKYGTDNQLGPDSKSMAEWKIAFSDKKIKSYPCVEHWKKLSEKDILDIYTHMHAHASDSPEPASCK